MFNVSHYIPVFNIMFCWTISLRLNSTPKSLSCHDASFVIIGDTGGRFDNRRQHIWWQSWPNDYFAISVYVSIWHSMTSYKCTVRVLLWNRIVISECHRIKLMGSQYWFRKWLGAIRQLSLTLHDLCSGLQGSLYWWTRTAHIVGKGSLSCHLCLIWHIVWWSLIVIYHGILWCDHVRAIYYVGGHHICGWFIMWSVIKFVGAEFSIELYWLDKNIGQQDSRPSNHRHSDMHHLAAVLVVMWCWW